MTNPMKMRIIRNWRGDAADAALAWEPFLFGERNVLGPQKIHVYGAHRRKRRHWRRVNVDFQHDRIVLVYPEGGML